MKPVCHPPIRRAWPQHEDPTKAIHADQLQVKVKQKNLRVGEVIPGGAGGIRTRYLFNAIEALSQLSYSPNTGQVAGSVADVRRGQTKMAVCQNKNRSTADTR